MCPTGRCIHIQSVLLQYFYYDTKLLPRVSVDTDFQATILRNIKHYKLLNKIKREVLLF